MKIKRRVFAQLRLLPLVIALLLLLPLVSEARERSAVDVELAAQTWVRRVTADSRPDATIAQMEAFLHEGDTVAYIAHLQGGGFCLCGADDRLNPVSFYSPAGVFDSSNPGLRVLLAEIADRSRAVKECETSLSSGDITTLEERALFWQELISGQIGAKPTPQETSSVLASGPTGMEIDFTPIWGQDPPYNDACPPLQSYDMYNCVTGCVATAMAQVMYYWKWPRNGGVGSNCVDYAWRERDTWRETACATDPGIPIHPIWDERLRWAGGTLGMKSNWDDGLLEEAQGFNVSQTYQDALTFLWGTMTLRSESFCESFAEPYDWAAIAASHKVGDGVPDQAVAQVMVEAGIAAGMNYGLWGSGAHLNIAGPDAIDALQDHFVYDGDAEYQGGALGGISLDLMIEDLQCLRPIIFEGGNTTLGGDGHAWVIYGYKYLNQGSNTWEFKMNFGWEGLCDGWYVLENITPSCISIHLNNRHGHIARLAPASVVRFVGHTGMPTSTSRLVNDGSPANPFAGIDAAASGSPSGTTLIFRAGYSETGSHVITSGVTLKGHSAVIGSAGP